MGEVPPTSSLEHQEAVRAAMETLGFTGAMLHPSKSGWRSAHPETVAIFNANVVIAGVGKVWFGDFWLSRDHAQLRELADRVGGRVYLLFEADGRFDHEVSPVVGNAVAWVDPGGELELNPRKLVWGDREIRWYRRRLIQE